MKKMKFPKLRTSDGAVTKDAEKGGSKTKKPTSFSQQLLGALIIFMCLTWGYSIITEKKASPAVPLSSFAQLVNTRSIISITVEGDSLTGQKTDGTKVSSKKETGASVFSTLAAYGVSSSTLATTTITISDNRGLSFWVSIVPIVLPILFLGFMIWCPSRAN